MSSFARKVLQSLRQKRAFEADCGAAAIEPFVYDSPPCAAK
jgi:hypothetical protein